MVTLISDVDCGKILSRYGEYLSDVSAVRYTRGGVCRRGFEEPTEMFCDNVTFSLPTGMDITTGVQTLRGVFGQGCKMTRADNGRGCVRILYTPVTEVTSRQLAVCASAGINMLDIDYTMDVRNITTRALVLGHLRAESDESDDDDEDDDSTINVRIADRGVKAVGRNCVSWWSDNVPARVDKVRCKVYNLFARSLEIAGVRVPFGSGVSELLEGSASATTLRQFQSSGVTRVELTFYGPVLLDRAIYRSTVVETIDSLRECPTFNCSLSQQWRTFREALIRIGAVHDVASSTFAVCQWWNSETGKMQGATRTIRRAEEVEKLLGNFSYPGLPIFLIRITEAGENVETYQRSAVGESLTVCAGRRGGLYPSGGQYELREYGDGVGLVGRGTSSQIGWPSTYTYRSRPLGLIELQSSVAELDDLNEALEALTIVNSHYTVAYQCLKAGQTYTVIGSGEGEYRGKVYTYVKLAEDDMRVRCGASLEALVRQHVGVRFMFTVDRIRRNKGFNDAICFINSASVL